MILNCVNDQTHEGRMPSSLLDVYVRYKQDTRAVVDWVVSHGTNKYKRPRTLSIKDLSSLAQVVQTKAVEMPAAVDSHFREAIAARTQLSKFFGKVNAQGIVDPQPTNHEHFTTMSVLI